MGSDWIRPLISSPDLVMTVLPLLPALLFVSGAHWESDIQLDDDTSRAGTDAPSLLTALRLRRGWGDNERLPSLWSSWLSLPT